MLYRTWRKEKGRGIGWDTLMMGSESVLTSLVTSWLSGPNVVGPFMFNAKYCVCVVFQIFLHTQISFNHIKEDMVGEIES